jgi:4-hydroxy 2-oxovalerate aldolase
MEVLDCTLRDGGYHNHWDFSADLVRQYLQAMSKAGIRFVEIGFREMTAAGFAGPLRFASETFVRSLEAPPGLELGVMVDANALLARDPSPDHLSSHFPPRSEAATSFVRIAATHAQIENVVGPCGHLVNRGYRVGLNLMQAGNLSESRIQVAAVLAGEMGCTWFYLADSFGSMAPDDVKSKVRCAADAFGGTVGFHAHDNMGLALANTLAARDAGAGIVDSTLRGMGRGAGNVRTEQLLLYLRWKEGREEFDPTALFGLVTGPMADLERRYHWGTDLPYMISAVAGIHPSYPQRMLTPGRFSPMEALSALDLLHQSGDAASFDQQRLLTAIEAALRREPARDAVPVAAPVFPKGLFTGAAVLIVGSGPSTDRRSSVINDFIAQKDPTIIQCNPQSAIQWTDKTFVAVVNEPSLEMRKKALPSNGKVILGPSFLSRPWAERFSSWSQYSYPCHVGKTIGLTGEGCTIPANVVGMYGIMAAIHAGPRQMYLVGFDGYAEHDEPNNDARTMQAEMESFFRQLNDIPPATVPPFVAITPSSYPIPKDSIYRLVQGPGA